MSFTHCFICGMGANNFAGSKLPCSVILLLVNALACCGETVQSRPIADAELLLKSSNAYHVPFGNKIIGASFFTASAIRRRYGCANALKSSGDKLPAQLSNTCTQSAPAFICALK